MRHVLGIVESDSVGDVDDAVGVVAEAVDDNAFGIGDVRDADIDHRDYDDVLVEHAAALDTGGGGGGNYYIYVHDNQLGTTTLVSKSSNGLVGNGTSPSISDDGQLIAFTSTFNSMVTGFSGSEVYVHNMQTGITSVVSDTPAHTDANGGAGSAVISGNGQYVAFESDSTNIVTGLTDTNNSTDVFVRNLATGVTTLVSAKADGTPVGSGGSFVGPINQSGVHGSISDDGHYITFMSYATNVTGTTDNNSNPDVFVRDTVAGTTSLVSVNPNGVIGNSASPVAVVSGDGRSIVFLSNASNLVQGDTNSDGDVFVAQYHRGTATLTDNPNKSTLSAGGSLSFADADICDIHTASAQAQAGDWGTLTATVIHDTTTTGTGGIIVWNYQVDEQLVHALNLGQSHIDTFAVTLDDGHGGTATQNVVVTLNGSTDTVSIVGNMAITLPRSQPGVQYTHTMTTSDLNINDPNGVVSNPTYTVSNPTHGWVALSGNALTPITSFTQAQLVAGSVLFVQDGNSSSEATFKVALSDGAGPTLATATVHAQVPDISIIEFTTSGLDFQNDNPIAELGGGVIQGGWTSNAVDIVNQGADREFVINGSNLAVSGGAITGGTAVSISEYKLAGHTLIAQFLMPIDAAAFYSAAVQAAGGDDSAFSALIASDSIGFSGSSGPDVFGSGDQNDAFRGNGGGDTFDGGFGFDRANYASSGPIQVDLADGTVTTPTGTDHLYSVEFITGSNSNDTFDARNFSSSSTNAGSTVTSNVNGTFNEFEGRGGDDTIIGNGDTRISYLHATAGVTVDIAAGTAVGDGSVGHDTFSGVDRVRGSYFDDILRGSNNPANTIEIFEGRGGNDLIDGRGGFDKASYQNEDSGINVLMAAGIVVGGPNTGTDTLLSIESITGTEFADIYNATNFSSTSTNAGSNGTFNEFEGGGGNDTITGNGNTRVAYTGATGGVTATLTTSAGAGNAAGSACIVQAVY